MQTSVHVSTGWGNPQDIITVNRTRAEGACCCFAAQLFCVLVCQGHQDIKLNTYIQSLLFTPY